MIDDKAPSVELASEYNQGILEHGEIKEWYINENKELFFRAEDKESGIREIKVDSEIIDPWAKVEEDLYKVMLTTQDMGVSSDPKDVVITAADKAGNQASQTLKIIYDKEAPKITSVSVNSSVPYFKQNGKFYFNSDSMGLDIMAEDNTRMSYMNYLIMDKMLDPDMTDIEIAETFYKDENLQKIQLKYEEGESGIKTETISGYFTL